jgi:hypothetical protein
VANVVGGAVVLTLSAVVPLVVARIALAFLISLMVLGRGEQRTPTQSSAPAHPARG